MCAPFSNKWRKNIFEPNIYVMEVYDSVSRIRAKKGISLF